MDLDEIKSRINPVYSYIRGTESYERKWLCDQIDSLRKQRDELLAALVETKLTLELANDTPNGPIRDTIWCGDAETLFDFIDAAIEKVGAGGTAVQGDMLLPANALAHGPGGSSPGPAGAMGSATGETE